MVHTQKIKPGINREAWLVRHLFDEVNLKTLPTRNGYGDGLVEAGKLNKILSSSVQISQNQHVLWPLKKPIRIVLFSWESQNNPWPLSLLECPWLEKPPSSQAMPRFLPDATGNKFAQPSPCKTQTSKSQELTRDSRSAPTAQRTR